jgi:23S rRNA pseudouridine1911/1915/1917 synthase
MKKNPAQFRSRTGKPVRDPARRSSPQKPARQDFAKLDSARRNLDRGWDKEDKRRPRYSRELSVLYEDDYVVVVDKPPGLLAVPVKGSDSPSALSLLVEHLEQQRQRALIVHRIDRFASGALVFAKTGQDRDALVKQFLAHTPVRQYLAVVRGRMKVDKGTPVHYFRKEGMYQQLRSARDPEAARAEMRYSVERRFTNASLVRVELVTGLQNQIRVQFAAMGHPVIGDRKYSRAESTEPLIDRVALHAAHVEFVHPRSKQTIAIDSKLPADFQRLIQGLSRSGSTRR